jgi:hypothetical protein
MLFHPSHGFGMIHVHNLGQNKVPLPRTVGGRLAHARGYSQPNRTPSTPESGPSNIIQHTMRLFGLLPFIALLRSLVHIRLPTVNLSLGHVKDGRMRFG